MWFTSLELKKKTKKGIYNTSLKWQEALEIKGRHNKKVFWNQKVLFKKGMKREPAGATGQIYASSKALRRTVWLRATRAILQVCRRLRDIHTRCRRFPSNAVHGFSFLHSKGYCGAAVWLVKGKFCCNTTRDLRSFGEKEKQVVFFFKKWVSDTIRLILWATLKGILHPKFKFHSFATRHFVSAGSGGILY